MDNAAVAKPVILGGATLADRVQDIERAFDGNNLTDGLVARFGRKDSEPDTEGNVTVTAYVEMVPAPEELEQDYQHHTVGKDGPEIETRQHTIQVFDAGKIAGHMIGERTSATGATLEEAISNLATKLGVTS